MRTDLYGLIHKAQRFHLFRLSEAIGETDFADGPAARHLAERVRTIIEHLRDHSRNEEIYIHPLFAGVANAADRLAGEHRDLESDLAAIERIVEEERWDNLYPAYARFVGSYLLHLSEEEAAQENVLWRHYDDDALMSVLQRFKAERSPQAARADLTFIVPALNVAELTKMFKGMKASAAPEVFLAAWDLAARVVPEPKWQRVMVAIH